MSKNAHNTEAIYDASTLGYPKMLILGMQHTFAMFGATVLVPIITGLNVSTTLLFAGLGTLLFHLITKGKVPAFLGSSFAFLMGYQTVAPMAEDGTANAEMLPYACGGVFCAGLLYVLLAGLIKVYGVEKIMRFFPPVVTGPIIIAIGLNLAPSAISNCQTNWIVALVAIVVTIVFNMWGKGMLKIIPILLGIVASYIVAAAMGDVNLSEFGNKAIVGMPVITLMKFNISSILTIMPIALATMMEHIGDINAISATTGKNYIKEPGLHRTLLGDGLATALASAFGGPANTTYGENTGVLALTKIYDPKVIEIAAGFAVLLSFIPKIDYLIESVPMATIGGISLILYGMISAVGIRNMVENHVDFSRSRNTIIAALILVLALGLGDGLTFSIAGTSITLSALATASLVGIIANAILPGNEYVYDEDTEDEKDKFQTYEV